jgi:hypothetical protein
VRGLKCIQPLLRRRIVLVRDSQGKAALKPSLATMEALVRDRRRVRVSWVL